MICVDCGREFADSRALMTHRRHKHRAEYPVLDETYPWMPWYAITAVDRGFETECWVSASGYWRVICRRILWERDGVRASKYVYAMHLCEIPGEPGRCVRPDHIVAGTASENLRHSHALDPARRERTATGLRAFIASLTPEQQAERLRKWQA